MERTKGAGVVRWWLYPLAGTLALVAYPFVPYDLNASAIYFLTVLSCFGAILVGLYVHQPHHRLPWLLMAAGQLSWLIGEVVYLYREDVLGISPTPSPADVFYLLAYPLLAAGIFVLVHRGRRGRDPADVIDTAVVTVGLGLLLWVLVAGPVVREDDGRLLDQLIALAYPTGDVLILAMLVHLMLSPGVRNIAFFLIVGAVIPLVVADALFATERVLVDQPFVLDMMWMASYVLWGSAALHPSMKRLTDERVVSTGAVSSIRPALLVGSALVLPVVLGVELALDQPLDAWALVIGATAIVTLAGGRLMLDVHRIRTTTEQRDQLELDLFHAASHDSLTGLANRAYMLEIVQAALDRGRASGAATGLLFVDIDHFKAVNDSVGPRGGDAVLRVTARRLETAAGAGNLVGRLAGDEFLVLVEGKSEQNEVMQVAADVLASIQVPIRVGDGELTVDASVGVTISMDAGTDVSHFLHEADVAADRAKAGGGGRLEVFDDALRQELDHRVRLEAELTTALQLGQLELHYQPVVALQSGVIDGYEALVRWDRPGQGLVPPDAFIPVAELSDLICRIDNWVLVEATCQLAAWIHDDPVACADLTIAVNISGRHLADPSIVGDVERALQRSGLPPHRLALEVTETVLVDVPTASLRLQALRELGVTISIDDFGTGYTSIGQLQNLPADALKIDRSFVGSKLPGTHELITLMVNAAHACGLLVIAEGVEHAEDVDMLRDLSCDSAQGFYIARPAPPSLIARSTPVVDSSDRRHLRPVRDET